MATLIVLSLLGLAVWVAMTAVTAWVWRRFIPISKLWRPDRLIPSIIATLCLFVIWPLILIIFGTLWFTINHDQAR